jgi:hypothetical protein
MTLYSPNKIIRDLADRREVRTIFSLGVLEDVQVLGGGGYQEGYKKPPW